jgi:heat shock protein HslJ
MKRTTIAWLLWLALAGSVMILCGCSKLPFKTTPTLARTRAAISSPTPLPPLPTLTPKPELPSEIPAATETATETATVTSTLTETATVTEMTVDPNFNPLAGSTWLLTSLDGTTPLAGTTLTLKFSEGGVSGSGGCNSFSGKYEVLGDALSIGRLLRSMKACLNLGVGQQESTYLKAISGESTFRLEGAELRILSEEGSELVFTPQ